LASGVAEDGAAGVGSLVVVAGVGCAGEGVSPADGPLEQPATANISAAATTKGNRLILISSMPNGP
jgi:hypothetical protein